MVQAVIREAATERMEFIMALAERIQQAVEVANVDVGYRRQLSDPGSEFGRSDGQGLVRAKRGKDQRRETRSGDRAMVAQVVGGVVRRANNLYPELFEDSVRSEVGGEGSVSTIPHRRCRGFVEKVGDSEIALEFKVGPVIQGVAQRVGD